MVSSPQESRHLKLLLLESPSRNFAARGGRILLPASGSVKRGGGALKTDVSCCKTRCMMYMGPSGTVLMMACLALS